MNEKELRELDAWIAEHVMGWIEDKHAKWVWHGDRARVIANFNPTIDGAFAMEVLKKCAEKLGRMPIISPCGEKWYAAFGVEVFTGETLEISICWVARKLFS